MQLILLGLEPILINTQAIVLAEQLGIPHISMQRLFSQLMHDRLSEELETIQQSDALSSPDAVKLAMLEIRLRQPDARSGWILTDFPTDLAQAKSLNFFLEYMGYPQMQAVFLRFSRSLNSARHPQWNQQLFAIVKYYQTLGCLTIIGGDTNAAITSQRLIEHLQISTHVNTVGY